MLYHHFRNYGCRINTDYFYKGLRVAVLENEYLRVSVLVDKGTDIFEFLYKPKDVDFMWLSPWGIRPPSRFIPTVASKEGSFMDYYEGGWQEILPNFGYGGTYYDGVEEGLHGEVCLLPWDCQIIEDSPSRIEIKFSIRCYRTPFYLEKTLSMKREDPVLYISETLVNEGYTDINFMWAHHPTFGGMFLDDSVIIDVPENKIKMIYKPGEKDGFKKVNDETIKWPRLEGYSGNIIDFSKSPTLVNGEAEGTDEVGLGELADGWYAVTNLNKKVGFGMKWDDAVFPYIWIWRVYGKGHAGGPWFGRVQCMALEICSSIEPDELYKSYEKSSAAGLGPQQKIETGLMAIAYEKDSGVSMIEPDGGIV